MQHFTVTQPVNIINAIYYDAQFPFSTSEIEFATYSTLPSLRPAMDTRELSAMYTWYCSVHDQHVVPFISTICERFLL